MIFVKSLQAWFKAINGRVPQYLSGFFNSVSAGTYKALRNSTVDNFAIPSKVPKIKNEMWKAQLCMPGRGVRL